LTLAWLGYRHVSSLDMRLRDVEKILAGANVVTGPPEHLRDL